MMGTDFSIWKDVQIATAPSKL